MEQEWSNITKDFVNRQNMGVSLEMFCDWVI
jgi:hypothetical protein